MEYGHPRSSSNFVLDVGIQCLVCSRSSENTVLILLTSGSQWLDVGKVRDMYCWDV